MFLTRMKDGLATIASYLNHFRLKIFFVPLIGSSRKNPIESKPAINVNICKNQYWYTEEE
jgi:hypothetical protein